MFCPTSSSGISQIWITLLISRYATNAGNRSNACRWSDGTSLARTLYPIQNTVQLKIDEEERHAADPVGDADGEAVEGRIVVDHRLVRRRPRGGRLTAAT